MLEGVQGADESGVFNLTANDSTPDQTITADGPGPPETVGEVVAAALEAQEEIVEMVVEEKVEEKVELDPIFPDHFYDGGNIPVFKPTIDEFRDFTKFITRINSYGMQVGIVKVIPPPEWREALPPLDDKVKKIRLKNAIEQQFAGSGGVFRQTNIEKRRIYNLPQWREICESTDHQPPARRGEVRTAGHIVGKRKPKTEPSPKKPNRKKAKSVIQNAPSSNTILQHTYVPLEEEPNITALGTGIQPGKPCPVCGIQDAPEWYVNRINGEVLCNTCCTLVPYGDKKILEEGRSTPSSADTKVLSGEQISVDEHIAQSVDKESSASPEPFDGDRPMDVDQPIAEPINSPTSSLLSRTLKRKRATSTGISESDPETDVKSRQSSDFRNFDYRISNSSEYTVDRCKELERTYWKTITFNNPMYGADLPGSLFDETTDTWNVANLDNLLCRIGKTIPGVNSAYLYLGMWKATFSWHVEDMDLYSINYIHFGAPKQWYSISQCDGEKFEAVMRSYFPNDHKGCPQFMRHKTFLASPSALESKGIKVNRLVHHEGEFVITFPFGYHSGYNLGYNCAESVNFATDEWLDIGRKARKCNCAEDSVNINVDDIICAIRGGPIPSDEIDVVLPPGDNVEGVEELKKMRKKYEKADGEGKKASPKKEKKPRFPCILCPNDPSGEPMLPTEAGKFVHRVCVEYIPETWIAPTEDGHEIAAGTEYIAPARWNLKCLYCSSTRGAKFQCSVTQCCRAYHATCALAAGILVETAEDEQGFVSSYQCRFHRPKRLPVQYLDQDQSILEFASKLQQGERIQARFAVPDNDVPFVGVVVENCESEQMVVIELATGELFEVAYKWILAPPKRDVRALCANQSVPGSTKQRKKKKAKPLSNDFAISVPPQTDLQTQEVSGISVTDVNNEPPSSIAISSPNQPPPPASGWTARNPGLAQYHQYVWQVQQQPHSSSNEDAFTTIMQRIQATPVQPKPQPKPVQPASTANHSLEIALPPPQFNLGQPPPTLIPAPKKEVPLAPKPTEFVYSPNLQRPAPPLQSQPQYSNLAGSQFGQTDTGQHQQWSPLWQEQFYRTPSSLINPQSHPPPPPPQQIPYPPTRNMWVAPPQPTMSPYHPSPYEFDAANPLNRG